jgi:hypothetical protein
MDRANGINVERTEEIHPVKRAKLSGLIRTSQARFLLAICIPLFITILVSHVLAIWTRLPQPKLTCRRIGPQNGPQVFCVGSSVVQFGLGWPEISEALGQGIIGCTLLGSSPAEWESALSLVNKANPVIIGVSISDLNESYLCEFRANFVPIMQTMRDLRQAHSDWQFSKRVLSQYPLTYLRILFPTVGKSDRVLVGARRKLLDLAGLPPTAHDQANFLVLPKGGVLKFGYSTVKLSALPANQVLRRLAGLRNEIHGVHRFDGPKKLAFFRMLDRAQQWGRVIVVIMPVAPMYSREFVTTEVAGSFENVLAEARRAAPHARFVRLDQLPALNSDDYYTDFVHMNGAGRQIATEAFLKQLGTDSRLP